MLGPGARRERVFTSRAPWPNARGKGGQLRRGSRGSRAEPRPRGVRERVRRRERAAGSLTGRPVFFALGELGGAAPGQRRPAAVVGAATRFRAGTVVAGPKFRRPATLLLGATS